MTYKIEGIILRSFDVREYDRIYTVFSEEKGLMRIFGVGVRKPKAKLASGLEPITKSELFCVRGRWMDRVAGVIIHDQYQSIKGSFDALWVVKRLGSVLSETLPENEQQSEVFDSLNIFLQKVNKIHSEVDVCSKKQFLQSIFLQLSVLWKVIKNTGYEPHLFYCSHCGKKIIHEKEYLFVIPAGLLCQNCKTQVVDRRILLSEDSVKILRLFIWKNPSIIAKVRVKQSIVNEVNNISILFLEYCFRERIT